MFSQKSSENAVDKSERLTNKIKEDIDHIGLYVTIDDALTKTIFALLINPNLSDNNLFSAAAKKALANCEFKYNHPLICNNLKSTSWNDLSNLNQLFHCNESIHATYAIHSSDKEFIQWVFYNYLNEEYDITIPNTIDLKKQPEIKTSLNQISYQHLISNEEMTNLVFMLQDPYITAEDKKVIGERICRANSMHNANINYIEESKLSQPSTITHDDTNKPSQITEATFFKPTPSNVYSEEKVLPNYLCISNGLVEEKNACLYIRGAAKITAYNGRGDELKIDNKGYRTLEMSAGCIKNLVENAEVLYNNEKLKPENGMITVMGFGVNKPNNTNSFRY